MPYPTAGWARQVHPELPDEDALARLSEQVLHVCRLDEDDPVAAWQERADFLVAAAERVTERRFDALRFEGPGTNLTVGLLPTHALHGGALRDRRRHRAHAQPPVRGGLRRPRPAAHRRRRARDQAAGHRAARSSAASRSSSATGARCASTPRRAPTSCAATPRATRAPSRLGEVALVDGEGRIGKLETVFFDTLLDENAASHIALGEGYRFTAGEEDRRAPEPLLDPRRLHDRRRRRRRHRRHAAGEDVPVLRGGAWQALIADRRRSAALAGRTSVARGRGAGEDRDPESIRGGSRPRHLGRPAARRRARSDQLARAVLRRRRLMTIALVATAVLLERTPAPPASERISVLDPLRALRHRATRGSGLVAVFYNFGFFTLLAYTPFALGLGAHELGYVFCGWGAMLAVFAVFVAPPISRRFGDIRGLAGALAGIAVLLAVMGVLHASQTALIVCVIVAGTFLGVTNTLMTQVVMESAPVQRPVASAAYSFVRFCGGAVAPFVAGKLGEHVSVASPFYLGAGMTAIAIVVLWHYRDALVPVVEPRRRRRSPRPTRPPPHDRRRRPGADARRRRRPRRAPDRGDDRARGQGARRRRARRPRGRARRRRRRGRDRPRDRRPRRPRCWMRRWPSCAKRGVPVTGEIVHSTGTHADVAARIMDRAALLSAGLIVIGADTERPALHGGIAAHVAAHAPSHVIVLNPRAGALGRPIPSVAAQADARGSGTPPEQLRFLAPGEVPERLNGRDWKSRNGGYLVRGFESLPLRWLCRAMLGMPSKQWFRTVRRWASRAGTSMAGWPAADGRANGAVRCYGLHR